MKILAICDECESLTIAILVVSNSRVAGVFAAPVGDIAQYGGSVSAFLRCRLSVTEECAIPAKCEVFKVARAINVGDGSRSDESGFPPEQLREMAGVRIADFESDVDHTQVRFAQRTGAPRSFAG